MDRLKSRGQHVPQAGDPIYGEGSNEQSCGMVVGPASTTEGDHELLAVSNIRQAQDSNLYLPGSSDTPLVLLHLPYQIPPSTSDQERG